MPLDRGICLTVVVVPAKHDEAIDLYIVVALGHADPEEILMVMVGTKTALIELGEQLERRGAVNVA